MRVCHLVYSYYPADPRVRRECEELQRAGHDVHVVALRDHGEVDRECVAGVEIHRVHLRAVRGGMLRYGFQYGAFSLEAALSLLRLYLRHRFDIIHVHSLPDFLVLSAIPEKLLGCKLVLDLHEAMPEILAARFHLPLSSLAVRAALAGERLSCLVANRVVVVNDSIKSLLANRSVSHDKLCVVMNSPDFSAQLRAPAFDPHAESRIVYAGGINSERDLHVLIRASARLQGAHPHELVLYGPKDEAYSRSLEKLASSIGLSGKLSIENKVASSAVLALLATSSVGPVTYKRNPLTELALPNKVFEYAAAGVPMVVANLPTLRQVFANAALFYEPSNEEDLARQISLIWENPSIARDLVEHARTVLEKCRWDLMAKRLLTLYRTLASGDESQGVGG